MYKLLLLHMMMMSGRMDEEEVKMELHFPECVSESDTISISSSSDDGIDFADERCPVSARDVVHASCGGPDHDDAVLNTVLVVWLSMLPKSEFHRNFAIAVEKSACINIFINCYQFASMHFLCTLFRVVSLLPDKSMGCLSLLRVLDIQRSFEAPVIDLRTHACKFHQRIASFCRN